MPDLYFNEESDYSEENTSNNEDFRSTIFQLFQFEPEQKKRVVMRAFRKKLDIFTLQLSIYCILIGNLDWCKCGHCKNEAREKGCLCYREVDAKLIALAKIPGRKRSISPSAFYGQLLDY